MTPDTGVMSELLKIFEQAFKGGYVDVQGFAFSLLGILVALELAFLGLWAAMGGQEVVGPFLKKLLAIGFFSWVVMRFDWLTQEVLSGFTSVGSAAAGAAGGDTKAITDPSYVISEGFRVTKTLFDYARNANAESWVGFAIDSFMAMIGAIFILGAFFLISLQIFITRVEFAMLVALGLILVPFGIFKHTAFLAEKTFGAILSFGIKLMVLTFIVSVAMPLLSKYSIPENAPWDPILNMVFVSGAIMYLTWHAPSITAGLLTGGPSLSGIGLATPVAAAAGAAVGASAAIAGTAIKGAVTGGVSTAMNAMRAAASAMGGSDGASSSGGAASATAQSSVQGSSGASAQSKTSGSQASSSSLQTARSVKAGDSSSSGPTSSQSGGSYSSGSEAKASLAARSETSSSGSNMSSNKSSESAQTSSGKSQASQGGPSKSQGPKGSDSGTAAGAKAGSVEEPQNNTKGSNSEEKSPISKGGQNGSSLGARIRHSAHRGKEAAKDTMAKAPGPIAGLNVPIRLKE